MLLICNMLLVFVNIYIYTYLSYSCWDVDNKQNIILNTFYSLLYIQHILENRKTYNFLF